MYYAIFGTDGTCLGVVELEARASLKSLVLGSTFSDARQPDGSTSTSPNTLSPEALLLVPYSFTETGSDGSLHIRRGRWTSMVKSISSCIKNLSWTLKQLRS